MEPSDWGATRFVWYVILLSLRCSSTETVEEGREETALHGTVEALVTLVEKRDWSLGHHSQQVADLVRQLALARGMSLEEAQVVALAGQLHDIGKVAIPDAILQKPGPLTEEEWEQMRRHSIVGAEVISCIPSLRPLAPVIRAHHERWDGQGYPDHLQGERIPLAARLIAVVDAYMVMITDRPYQLARPPAVVLVELQRCAGSQFDPRVVEELNGLLRDIQVQSQREVASMELANAPLSFSAYPNFPLLPLDSAPYYRVYTSF